MERRTPIARLDWPTAGGILYWGVVTETRSLRTDLYQRLSLLFQWQAADIERERMPHLVPFSKSPRTVPLRLPIIARRGSVMPIDLQPVLDSTSARESWRALEQSMAKFWAATDMAQDQWARTGKELLFWRDPGLEINNVPFTFPNESGFVRPLVVTPDVPRLSIPIGKQCDYVYLLGNGTFSIWLSFGRSTRGSCGSCRSGLPRQSHRTNPSSEWERNRQREYDPRRNADRACCVRCPTGAHFRERPGPRTLPSTVIEYPVNGFVTDLVWNWKSGPPLTLFAVTVQDGNVGVKAG